MADPVDLMFGEWLPDVADYQNPGLLVAENVIPRGGAYRPQYGLVAQSDVATGAIRGAQLMFTSTGGTAIVGGTTSRLFVTIGGTVTETTPANPVVAPDCWDFCRFNDFVIATTLANAPYHLSDLDSDTSWSLLAGSPPNAKYCARVGDFVMLGNIADHPNRVHWGAFNSPGGAWAPARLTQAGYNDLTRDFGAVQRIVGGRYSMVFQERGVQRVEYVGPPGVHRFTEIEDGRGCVAPFSVVNLGFVTYYLAQDGFWSTDGNSFEPIGTGRVNKWFFENVNVAKLGETHGTVDFENERIVWAFKAGSGAFDRLISYSYSENRWSHGRVDVNRLVETVLGGLTLEQIAALYPVLEDVPASFDDPRWMGRNRVMAAYVDGASTTDRNAFSGERLAAYVETGEFQPAPGRRVHSQRARPLGDGAENFTAAAIAIDNDRTETVGAFNAVQAAGWAPIRADGQSMRLAVRAAAGADWRSLQGAQVGFRPSGGR
jgi:hypothetical protein